MPFVPSSFLLLVAMPGAPNSVLAPSSQEPDFKNIHIWTPVPGRITHGPFV